MSILYLMCGIPGSGKSSFVTDNININRVAVSRDQIRFSMIKEDEEYFSKEKQVFAEFVKSIEFALEKGKSVFADATHLNKASRAKLLRAIDPVLYSEISVVWIDTPLGECLKRNELRKGTRSYVPKEQIRRMYFSFQKPELDEGFDRIYIRHWDSSILEEIHR